MRDALTGFLICLGAMLTCVMMVFRVAASLPVLQQVGQFSGIPHLSGGDVPHPVVDGAVLCHHRGHRFHVRQARQARSVLLAKQSAC